jgi:hypothetical protein
MTSETKAAATVHGSVEYETRTCASCDQEFLPEDTETLYHGSLNRVSSYSTFTSIKFDWYREVYFCEQCFEKPTKCRLPARWRITSVHARTTVSLLAGMVCTLVVLVLLGVL